MLKTKLPSLQQIYLIADNDPLSSFLSMCLIDSPSYRHCNALQPPNVALYHPMLPL